MLKSIHEDGLYNLWHLRSNHFSRLSFYTYCIIAK